MRSSRAGRASALRCRATASARCRCCGGSKALAEDAGRQIPVRLVKGAYWDSEIKWAQERGLADYPVFTRKAHTDVSYLAAMRFMLANGRRVLSPVRDAQRAHDCRRV